MKRDPRTIIDLGQDPSYLRTLVETKPKTQIFLPEPLPQFHWKPDKLDKRDFIYTSSNKNESTFVDLRQYCTPIEDQGNLGSCTGQAIASAIELLNKRNGGYKDISRLFIYYFNRLWINRVNVDSGAYIRDGIKTVFNYGAPLENLWPYIITRFRARPHASAMNDALKRKVTLYERVNDHQGCLDAITNGYPVIVGFYVFSSFVSRNVLKTGMMPYPDVGNERFLGGHAVLLVGYDKKQNRYIARNSWGHKWGDKGYFYMPFQVIQDKRMSGDFWIIKSVNNP